MNIKPLLVSIFAMILISTTSQAANWHEEIPNAQVLGSGDFHWFGFKIYNAKLWTETSSLDMSRPFALELTYNRSINRRLLVQIVISEIKRLNGDEVPTVKIQEWQKKLTSVFPNISPSDELIGVYLPFQGFRVYCKQGLIADIRDPELAHYFFAVWLDKRAKDSALRSKLLGLTSR